MGYRMGSELATLEEELKEFLIEGEHYMLSMDFDRALDMYLKALKLDKNNEDACNRLLQIYAVRGLYKNFIAQSYEMVRILDEKGEHEKALDLTRRTIGLKPEDDKIRKKAILLYKRQNNTQKLVEESIALAMLYFEEGMTQWAVKIITRVQELAPDNHDIGVGLAEIYMRQGQIKEAADKYRELGRIFIKQGAREKAFDAYRKLKVLVTTADSELLVTLGNLYMEHGSFDQAESEFREALKLNINDMEALNSLGTVCQKKGSFRDAILAFTKVQKLNPKDINATQCLAELNKEIGNKPMAVKHYLEVADHYVHGGNVERAVELYKLVLELEPENEKANHEVQELGKLIMGAGEHGAGPEHVE
jgi:tetratricopeptide (TPR) repeat protein